eukprot:m.53808 g.53808  ORF g.53808 m.53808 type:complete len:770 (-) comp12413_c0_seq1:260-2569(-)
MASSDKGKVVAADEPVLPTNGHRFKRITLDGKIEDVLQGMHGQLAERNASVGEWGCRAIMDYAKASEASSLQVTDLGADAAMTKSMKTHPDNPGLQAQACQALSHLACSDTLRERLREAGFVQLVANALKTHTQERPVQLHGCSAVTELAQLADNAAVCVECGVPGLVVASLGAFDDDHALYKQACRAIATLSGHSADARIAVAAAGGVQCIYAAIRKSNQQPMALRRACEALEKLAIHGEIRSNMGQDGGVQLVMDLLNKNKASCDVVQGACRLVARLAQNEVNRLIFLGAGIMDTIVDCMQRHLANVDVQLYSCWALVELAAEQGEDGDSTDVHEQVVDAVLASMTKHLKNVDVHRYGCKALENLGSRSELQRVQIGEKNGSQIILNGVREHVAVAVVQAPAFHALAVLASHDAKMHVHMVQLRAVESAETAFKKHAKDGNVMANVCRFLANIALTANVREKLVKEKFLPRVVAAVERYKSHAEAQHYGLWCIENLIIDAIPRAWCFENGGVKLALRAIETLLDDADVVVAALRVLERLAVDAHGHVVLSVASVSAALQAVKAHEEDDDVVLCSLAALAMLTRNVKNKASFAQRGGLDAIVNILRQMGGIAGVVRYSCGVLSNVALKDPKFKSQMARTGALELVLKLLQTHKNSVHACVAACAALRNATSQHESNRKAMISLDAISAVTQILQLHQTDVNVVYWTAAVLCNLARDPAGQLYAVEKARGLCLEVSAWLEQECPQDPAFAMVSQLLSRLPAQPKGQKKL